MSENTKTAVSPESPQGFYASALQGEFLAEYQRALKMEGIGEEIALLRAYIKMILIRSTTAGMNYFLKAITCLDHLCKTNKKMFFDKYAELNGSRMKPDWSCGTTSTPPGKTSTARLLPSLSTPIIA